MPGNDMGKDELGSILDELDLDAGERQIFARALGISGTSDTILFLDRVMKLRAAALKEFVNWIIGRTRFSSVSESDMHRVIELFLNVRQEAPSVDRLVSELRIPAARATSLLARLRYGEGRALTALALRSAASRLKEKLSAAQLEAGDRKSVWVDGDSVTHIRHAAMVIMEASPELHNKGGRFQGAQFPEITSYGREGGVVKTTSTMWDYIIATLISGAEGAV